MHRWARRFICTSALLPALGWAGEAPPHPGRVAALELEARLARRPVVYLVLDVGRGMLEIRSRSLVLDSMAVTDLAVVRQRGLFERSASKPHTLPTVWTIVEGPRDTDRELIAPETLRPAPRDDEEVSEEAAPAGGPSPTPTPIPDPPKSYRARMDNGLDLMVTDRLPAASWWHRMLGAAWDGLARIRGQRESVPPAVVVVMSRTDARRLYHLIRSDTSILVTTEFP